MREFKAVKQNQFIIHEIHLHSIHLILLGERAKILSHIVTTYSNIPILQDIPIQIGETFDIKLTC